MDDPPAPSPPSLVGSPGRLAALHRYGILDTSAEKSFDDIVLLARAICKAPVALVSFIGEDRQWFKARSGLAAHQTPIEQSVCAHALGSTDPLVIPDLRLDERTRANPLVTEAPHFRFYAGAPLRSGVEVVGTLCVLDVKPRMRGLTFEQQECLEALADQTMTLLDLRLALERATAPGT